MKVVSRTFLRKRVYIYQIPSLTLRKFTANSTHHQVNFTKIEWSGLGPRIDSDLASATSLPVFIKTNTFQISTPPLEIESVKTSYTRFDHFHIRKFEMNVSSEYLAVRFRIDTGDGYSASGRCASGAVVLL